MGPAHLVVRQHLLSDRGRAFDQWLGQFGELLLLDLVGLAVGVVLHRQCCAGADREASLGGFDFQGEGLQAAWVLTRVGMEVGQKPIADGPFQGRVPVDATQVQVSAAGHHADLVLVVLDQREVEGATAEVVDQDPLLVGQFGEPQALRAQHIAQCRGNRLVDDVDLLEPGPVARLDCGSSLQLAELGRHGDHGPFDRSDLFVGGCQQFSEHVTGDVDRSVVLPVDGPAV